jgi:hypothetical protein
VLRWRRNVMSRSWVAIAAAYLLVLQATFAGLASGAKAASISLGYELTLTLCAHGSTTGADIDHSGPTGPHADLSCCSVGCSISASGLPAKASFEPAVHYADEVTLYGRPDRLQAFLAVRSPANPRAPPYSI